MMQATALIEAPSVEQLLETICARGCRSVRAFIEAMEQGTPIAELESLGPAQRAALLQELKAIMAVYG